MPSMVGAGAAVRPSAAGMHFARRRVRPRSYTPRSRAGQPDGNVNSRRNRRPSHADLRECGDAGPLSLPCFRKGLHDTTDDRPREIARAQGARDHVDLLGHQAAHHRHRRDRLGRDGPAQRADRRRRGRPRLRLCTARATADRPLSSADLLDLRADARRLRHDGRRRPQGRARALLRRHHARLRGDRGRRVPRLVPQRGHAVDPQHQQPAAREASTGAPCSPPSRSAPPPAT